MLPGSGPRGVGAAASRTYTTRLHLVGTAWRGEKPLRKPLSSSAHRSRAAPENEILRGRRPLPPPHPYGQARLLRASWAKLTILSPEADVQAGVCESEALPDARLRLPVPAMPLVSAAQKRHIHPEQIPGHEVGRCCGSCRRASGCASGTRWINCGSGAGRRTQRR